MIRMASAALGVSMLAANLAAAQPENDDCANATVIGAIPFHDAIAVTDATQEVGDPNFACEASPSGQQAKTVWYRYTAPSATNLEATTLGSDYNTILGAFRGTCGSLTLAFCNEDDPDRNRPDGEDSSMLITLDAGETIYIAVGDEDDTPAASNLVLDIGPTPLFVANGSLDDTSYYPRGAVAAGTTGDFLVVWANFDQVIRGRLFNRHGRSKGAAFDIATATDTFKADVAADGAGNFVVVWGDYVIGPDVVMARRVDGSGTPVGAPFQVNVGSVYAYPAVAADAAGNFVVAWTDGSDEISAQRIDTSDVGLVADVDVGPNGRWPAVAMAPDGRFVIAWTDHTGLDGSGYGVVARRFDATSSPLGGFLVANTYTTSTQGDLGPDVAMTDTGDFVVVWSSSYFQDAGIQQSVHGRMFDATGAAVTGEFQVNTGAVTPGYYGDYGDGKNDHPSVAADGNGEFVVAWHRQSSGPYGRRLDAAGTPAGDEFQIGTFWANYQGYYRTDVSATQDGGFMVVWDETTFNNPTNTLGRGFPVSGCPSAPASGCKQSVLDFKGKLKIKDKADEAKDLLVWKWAAGDAVTLGEIGDPTTSDGFTLCLWDGGGTAVTEAAVSAGGTCDGKPCWKGTKTGYLYKDKAGTAGGVQKLLVKAADAGKSKLVVKAKGTNLDTPSLPLALPATLQLHGDAGTCWTATFDVSGLQRNTADAFGGQAEGTP